MPSLGQRTQFECAFRMRIRKTERERESEKLKPKQDIEGECKLGPPFPPLSLSLSISILIHFSNQATQSLPPVRTSNKGDRCPFGAKFEAHVHILRASGFAVSMSDPALEQAIVASSPPLSGLKLVVSSIASRNPFIMTISLEEETTLAPKETNGLC